jgi:superoxide dismutase, Cu-Zn family
VSISTLRNCGFAFAAAATIAGCQRLPFVTQRVASATVDFIAPGGASRGSGVLWQDPEGRVHLELRFNGLPAGTHGIHFHAVGRCDGTGATAFTSAGLHFNPHGRRHGLSSVDGPHAGDLPNVTISANGTAQYNQTTDRISLTTGATNILDANGTALIVHTAADDQITDPAGNSGARIACGVVRRS